MLNHLDRLVVVLRTCYIHIIVYLDKRTSKRIILLPRPCWIQPRQTLAAVSWSGRGCEMSRKLMINPTGRKGKESKGKLITSIRILYTVSLAPLVDHTVPSSQPSPSSSPVVNPVGSGDGLLSCWEGRRGSRVSTVRRTHAPDLFLGRGFLSW